RSGGKTPRIPQAKLEQVIREITARWDDRFEALAGAKAPKISVDQAFQDSFTPEETVADLADIGACAAGEPLRIQFYHRQEEQGRTLSLKIFHAGGQLAL
ncbi:hypothetical protein ACC771_14070, partial [Rhizobium ruizarguesonis]